MRKIKVVHVLNTGSYSGAENVTITIIKNTSSEIDSVYLSLYGDIEERLKESKIKYYCVDKLSPQRLHKAFRDLSPDIIHAHDYTAGVISVLANTNVPIISHIHNNSPWIKRLNAKSITYAISCLRYKTILTVSESIMNEFMFGFLFKKKSKVFGNPIDKSSIIQMSKAYTIDERYDLIFLGRFTEAKNPHLFIEIVKKLCSRLPDINIIMIGDGELKESVKDKVYEYGLEGRVTIKGFMDNPYVYLRQSRVGCMPSSWEGYGLVAVECLILGKPVVCSNVGGLKDVVQDSCGRICNSIEDYEKEIYKLLTDFEYYCKKSENAKRRSEDLTDLSTYTANLIDVYKQNI